MMDDYIRARYTGDFHRRVAVREFVLKVCRQYVDRGIADANFEQNLCCGDEARYWQRLSEALVAHELLEVGLELRPSRDGPDLLVNHGDAKIWVEIMCPEPAGIPGDWLQGPVGTVVDFPHEA